MSSTPQLDLDQQIDQFIMNAQREKDAARDLVTDLLLLLYYPNEYLANFGIQFCGLSLRQNRTDVLMTVKVLDSGTPLVGFITSATTIGCVEKFLDLLEADRVTWTKDKFPWI